MSPDPVSPLPPDFPRFTNCRKIPAVHERGQILVDHPGEITARFSWEDKMSDAIAKTFGGSPAPGRDPVNAPSAHSQRSIAQAASQAAKAERRRVAGERGVYVAKGIALVLAGVLVMGFSLLAYLRRFHLLALLLGVSLALAGCSAEQLAREEAAAHAALTKLEVGIDWVNANPDTVQAVLDDAAKASSDPALQKAVAKAKAAVASGDLKAAQRVVSLGAAITAPVGPPAPDQAPAK